MVRLRAGKGKDTMGANVIAKTHKLTSEIIQLIGQITHNYIALGRALCTMRDGKYYRQLGDHVETMDDFLVEIRLSRSTAYNLMAIHERFGGYITPEMQIDYTRLVRALPIAEKIGTERVIKLLSEAELLPTQAYYDQIRELKGKIATDVCDHSRKSAYEKCDLCGKGWKL